MASRGDWVRIVPNKRTIKLSLAGRMGQICQIQPYRTLKWYQHCPTVTVRFLELKPTTYRLRAEDLRYCHSGVFKHIRDLGIKPKHGRVSLPTSNPVHN